MVYLGLLGGGFTLGLLRAFLFKSREGQLPKVATALGNEMPTPVPRTQPPISSPPPTALPSIFDVPLDDLSDPPDEDPPEGENADVGEEAREELVNLRSDWIDENEEAFNEHAEGAYQDEFESPMEVEVVEEDDSSDDDFDERLEREGGKTGVMQITLLWNNYNDLDLHVFCPSGERIYFNNRKSKCGGELDVDMNVKPTSRTPVENVVWMEEPAKGDYRVCVHHYARHRRWRTRDPTKFRVRVRYEDDTKELKSLISKGDPMVAIHRFTI